jgi:hypothetical protein
LNVGNEYFENIQNAIRLTGRCDVCLMDINGYSALYQLFYDNMLETTMQNIYTQSQYALQNRQFHNRSYKRREKLTLKKSICVQTPKDIPAKIEQIQNKQNGIEKTEQTVSKKNLALTTSCDALTIVPFVDDDIGEQVISKEEDGVMIENHMDTLQTYTQTIKMESATQDVVSTKKTPIHMHLIVNNYSQPTTPQSKPQPKHFTFMSVVDVSNEKINSMIEQNKELLERMNEMDIKMEKLSEEMEGLRWWRKGFYEWVRELRREWGSFKAGTLKLKSNKR